MCVWSSCYFLASPFDWHRHNILITERFHRKERKLLRGCIHRALFYCVNRLPSNLSCLSPPFPRIIPAATKEAVACRSRVLVDVSKLLQRLWGSEEERQERRRATGDCWMCCNRGPASASISFHNRLSWTSLHLFNAWWVKLSSLFVWSCVSNFTGF